MRLPIEPYSIQLLQLPVSQTLLLLLLLLRLLLWLLLQVA
jgi:hypothetical protein